MLNATKPTSAVYHIVNPNMSAHWKDVHGGLEASGVSFKCVDKNEWVERLEKSDEDGKRNPTIKLLVSSFPGSRLQATQALCASRSSV